MWPRFYRPPTAVVFVSQAISFVARDFGLTTQQIFGSGRTTAFVYSRAVIAKYLHRQGMSVTEIGRRLKRDHSTISHSLNNWDIYLSECPELGVALDRVMLLGKGANVSPMTNPLLFVNAIPATPQAPRKRKDKPARSPEDLDEADGLSQIRSIKIGSRQLAEAMQAALAA